jgi:hypothetical protein
MRRLATRAARPPGRGCPPSALWGGTSDARRKKVGLQLREQDDRPDNERSMSANAMTSKLATPSETGATTTSETSAISLGTAATASDRATEVESASPHPGVSRPTARPAA